MRASNIPAKLPLPWAANAQAGYIRTIPTASQINITPGAASLNDGFPPLNFTPEGSGGIPPFGEDMNGILNWVSAWVQWENAGAPVGYDSTFSTAIGGYPNGAWLTAGAGGFWWMSLVDNNTSDPDTGGANWMRVDPRLNYVSDTGTVNALVVALTPAITAYFNGLPLTVKIANTNTNACTINAGAGAVPLVRNDGGALHTGDLVAASHHSCYYDFATSAFVLTGMVYSQFGTASLANASSNTGTVAAVSGTIAVGHIAVFADTAGTVEDSGTSLITVGQTVTLTIANNNNTLQPGSYAVDTTGGAFSVNLALTVGGFYTFIDVENNWSTANFTVSGNGHSIGNNSTNVAATFLANVCDYQFSIEGATTYWRLV